MFIDCNCRRANLCKSETTKPNWQSKVPIHTARCEECRHEKTFLFFFFTMWCWIHIKRALKLNTYWGRQSTREKTEISHHLHWSHSSAVTCAKLKVWWLAEPTVPEIAGRVCFSLEVEIKLWWNCEDMISESEYLYSNSTLCALWEISLCEIWTHVKSFFAT